MADQKSKKRAPILLRSLVSLLFPFAFFKLKAVAKTAEEWKTEGNAAYNSKDYFTALKYYTSAIDLDPSNAIYHSNRAMVHLKLCCLDETIEDCDNALKYDPKSIKSLLRKATALQALEMDGEAIKMLEKVIDLDPKNKQALKELDELRASQKSESGAESKVAPVEESKEKTVSKNEANQYNAKPVTNPGAVSVQKIPDEHVPTIAVPTEAPRDRVIFDRIWNNLRDAEDKYAYWKLIAPSSYATLFASSVPTELFSSVLKFIGEKYIRDGLFAEAAEVLKGLTAIPRFDILLMFLSESETKGLKPAVEKLVEELGDGAGKALRVYR